MKQKNFKPGFKERLAFLYLLSTASIIFILFMVIIFTVKQSAYHYLDNSIIKEAHKHLNDITINENTVSFNNKAWQQEEHQVVEVNPVFIQVTDLNGNAINKSPNLKTDSLTLFKKTDDGFTNSELSGIPIRQYQQAIDINGKTKGYLLVALSQKGPVMVLKQLKTTLLFAFPIVLIILFFWTRFIAGKGIKPVTTIIHTAKKITQSNLEERIPVPQNKDELYQLVQTINQLLDRIENAIKREKRFTSDAAHELKTPLQVMKGNMEILMRKPRTTEEYQNKISQCMKEVDRMSHLTDQLLMLARFESQKEALKKEEVMLNEVIEQIIFRRTDLLDEKKIKFSFNNEKDILINTDPYLLNIILENLLSNAIKYTPEEGEININTGFYDKNPYLQIRDTGVGIPKEEQSKIFDRFYRSEAMKHPGIKGSGLGLSIVKRLTEILSLNFTLESESGKGTTISIYFPIDE
ncbi:MAG: HAMP domain-containing histidine kinase [Bacteroidales bacterium]|nr:HAMP domain-containing histidine kinase [Bacteroidales bacterium]